MSRHSPGEGVGTSANRYRSDHLWPTPKSTIWLQPSSVPGQGWADPTPCRPGIRALKEIRAMIRPEPTREAPPPPQRYARPRATVGRRRHAGVSVSGTSGTSSTPRARRLPTTPNRVSLRSSGRLAPTAIAAVGSPIIAPGKVEQFPLGIWEPALGCDAAEPVRQLTVVHPGMCRPAVPVGGDILQCGRVFI
jgi:hypothetical protein